MEGDREVRGGGGREGRHCGSAARARERRIYVARDGGRRGGGEAAGMPRGQGGGGGAAGGRSRPPGAAAENGALLGMGAAHPRWPPAEDGGADAERRSGGGR